MIGFMLDMALDWRERLGQGISCESGAESFIANGHIRGEDDEHLVARRLVAQHAAVVVKPIQSEIHPMILKTAAFI